MASRFPGSRHGGNKARPSARRVAAEPPRPAPAPAIAVGQRVSWGTSGGLRHAGVVSTVLPDGIIDVIEDGGRSWRMSIGAVEQQR